jgi:hypothetical protein
MIKALMKLGTEGTYFIVIKANIILDGKNLEPFSLKSGMQQGYLFSPMLIKYSFRIPSQRNKKGGRNEKDSNREGRSRIIPIEDNMILS